MASTTGQQNQKMAKSKAVWNYDLHKSFIDLCTQELKNNENKGTFFSKDGWSRICTSFNSINDKEYERKQLKNHWDSTKADWKLWYKLKNYESGPGWNDEKNIIVSDKDWWNEYIQGCIGAIDGTHIDAIVPVGEQLAFRGRKGKFTQNVMAACSFDMRFTFVWAGWEGSAHDSRILHEALLHPTLNFPRPPNGKYYLVDAGYANMTGFLAPFKTKRYHRSHFQNSGQTNGLKEVFNRRHSSLKNVIERCFGVWKARWPILRCMSSYPFDTQRLIVVATMTVHDFIRQEAKFDAELRRYDEKRENLSSDDESDSDEETPNIVGQNQQNEMDITRIAIANSILAS